MNATVPAAENASINATENLTAPVQNETVAVEEIIPAAVEAAPVVNETAVASVGAETQVVPTIIPAAGILGKMETRQAEARMLGMTVKPTFVVGSGLSNSDAVVVGSTKARPTYTVGSATPSTV